MSAVNLVDSSINLILSTPIYGMGQASAVAFGPDSQTSGQHRTDESVQHRVLQTIEAERKESIDSSIRSRHAEDESIAKVAIELECTTICIQH